MADGKEIEKADVEFIPYDSVTEAPLGEEVEKPYIGMTKMFSEHQDQVAQGMLAKTTMRNTHLHWHVPIEMRGPYKLPEALGDTGLLGERVGPARYALCTATVMLVNNKGLPNKKAANPGGPCRAKAINRSGLCSAHAGQLHPLDRKRINWDLAPRHIQFKYGRLSVDELSDEELARGQIFKGFNERGERVYTDNKFVSVEISQQMIAKLNSRAEQEMRTFLLVAVRAAGDIAGGTAYEPADRLNAAKFIIERLQGKTPQEINIGVSKPFEDLLDSVLSGGSRAESRAARGVSVDETIDAEVVEVDDLDFVNSEIQESQGLIGDEVDQDETVEEGDTLDYSQDKTVEWDEHKPADPVHHGPTGRPTSDRPADPLGNVNHERQKRSAEEAAAEEEAKWLRRAHKEKVRKELRRRKYFASQGKADVPQNAQILAVEEEDGTTTMRFVFVE